MDKMGKYCCFLCPDEDFSDKSLDALCPTCGKKYGFPLTDRPESIGDYKNLIPLGRGFYSAIFTAEFGEFRNKRVLKVVPDKVYSFFKKDFENECWIHNDLAQDSEHIIKIERFFPCPIDFGGITVDCSVSVLQYVEGETLYDFLSNTPRIEARELAQISIDLFSILSELDSKLKHHNDLHGNNMIVHRFTKGRRADAIADWLKVYLIDLGSVADESRSNGIHRIGDRHWVARHLQEMVDQLLRDPDSIDPLNYRLSSTLARHIQWLYPYEPNTRQVSPDEAIEQIRSGFSSVVSPWRETKKSFKRLSDTYNAQSLDSWFIPSLIVDPEGQWEKKISAHGPQVITGMRGCGKTVFLKSLHFHSRAVQRDGENPEQVIHRLSKDGYVGLYASAQDLVTAPGDKPTKPINPFERLFVQYVKDAVHVLRHLSDIDSGQITAPFHQRLAELVVDCLGGPEELRGVASDYDLEIQLERLRLNLGKGDSGLLMASQVESFSRFADTLRALVPLWNNSQVLFLLDDLSTRYLPLDSVGEFVSSLLFQKPNCAFKITTEGQTFEEVLRSPGLIERARVGRDYEIFDLGSEVYERAHQRVRKGEKHFVEQVLEKRIQYYEGHPHFGPREVLGDRSLREMGNIIATSGENSRTLKSAYTGITALTQICVGDIGDVIRLYEEILKRAAAERQSMPVKPETQTDAMLFLSGDRLWRLDRQTSKLKSFAKSFAEASHALLVKSLEGDRLRQYYGIYVRLTSGDTEAQFQKLRELIDAGVFVFQGGAPRTKTRDTDPALQFKLVFRKLYGLTSYIPLSDKDRFELSGDDLEDWLKNPERGKEILTRNLGLEEEEEYQEELEEIDQEEAVRIGEQLPLGLFDDVAIDSRSYSDIDAYDSEIALPAIQTQVCNLNTIGEIHFDAVILGLGFEQRTYVSALRLLDAGAFDRGLLVRYPEEGKSKEIIKEVNNHIEDTRVIDYKTVLMEEQRMPRGNVLVDITGLSKPAIFKFVRSALLTNGHVWACRTKAEKYYPGDESLSSVVDIPKDASRYDLLKAAEGVLTGEYGPYKLINLYSSGAGEDRRRVMFAFSSPKHERLMRLLDDRNCERYELVSHPAVTKRGMLAKLAAEIAADEYQGCNIIEIESDDFQSVLDCIYRKFDYWYVDKGFGFETGLTGSKIQALACSAASTSLQFTNVWYVAPERFDSKRFTEGVGETTIYHISLAQNS